MIYIFFSAIVIHLSYHLVHGLESYLKYGADMTQAMKECLSSLFVSVLLVVDWFFAKPDTIGGMVLILINAAVFFYLLLCNTKARRQARPKVKQAKPICPPPLEMVLTEDESKMKMLFDRVEEYMEEKKPFLEEDFQMSDLAEAVFTNKAYLSKTINKVYGNNFCQYVNSYRVKYAVELMEKDDRVKVVELAMLAGFHSVVSFNMAFKLFMNTTPSEYQRTVQSKRLQSQ